MSGPACAVCFVLVLLACWVGAADFVLVVDRVVMRPQEVSLALWSIGVLASAAVVVRTLVRHRRGVAARSGHLAIGGALALTLLGTGAWCAGSAAVAGGAAALGPDAFTPLRTTDGSGCPLVAHESARLRSSSGRLYRVDALGAGRPIGSWSADEIQLPVRDGDYSLQWEQGIATLAFRTDRPIAPERLRVVCRP